MVGGQAEDAARLVDRRLEPAQLQVHSFHGTDDRVEHAGVAHHVAVREVQADVVVLAALDRLDNLVGDLRALHPGPLLEGHHVGGDLHVVLKLLVELALLVSVEEVGHVPVLLGLGDGQELHAGLGQVLAHRAVDARRVHQVLGGHVGVAVVLHHAGVLDRRNALAVKGQVAALGGLECAGHLQGAVAAEVEVDDAVAVLYRADGLAALGNDELVHVLVQDAGNF